MSWKKLVNERRVARQPATREELGQLRAIARRSLADAQLTGLSTDGAFGLAYTAARCMATVVVRAAGYRVKGLQGAHYYTFMALETADPKAFLKSAIYFNVCRGKRNDLQCSGPEVISEGEAAEILQAVPEFFALVDRWLREHHPELA
jgi:hypothetical protein